MDLQEALPNYKILKKIGEGGMSDIWLAEHRRNLRKVAIKVLRKSGQLSDAENEELFLREGEVLASFNDRNIITIYDNDRHGDYAYLAMEYIPGGTLLDRMRRSMISVGEAIGLIVQIASALGAAHRRGIVHRDLKPENILMRDDTTPVLTDFGAARIRDRNTIFSKDGATVGTPVYMSPEQVTGQELDGRSDIYAIGILFFELLTGKKPFRGGSFTEIASQHLYAPIPKLPDELAPLQHIIDTLLAKSAEQRYSTTQGFIDALRSVVLGDTQMRRYISHSANSPAWTTQLRALGFILDNNERTEVLPVPEGLAPTPAPSRPQGSPTPAIEAVTPDPTVAAPLKTRRSAQLTRWPVWLLPSVIVLALLLAGGAYWQHQRQQAAERERLAPLAAAAQADFNTAWADYQTLLQRFAEPVGPAALAAQRASAEAQLKRDAGDYAGATEQFRSASTQLTEDRRRLLETLKQRYTTEARSLMANGQLDAAERVLERARDVERLMARPEG
jgi:serine/threonine-protein kinase PpkA